MFYHQNHVKLHVFLYCLRIYSLFYAFIHYLKCMFNLGLAPKIVHIIHAVIRVRIKDSGDHYLWCMRNFNNYRMAYHTNVGVMGVTFIVILFNKIDWYYSLSKDTR